jgi:hypothetical protein
MLELLPETVTEVPFSIAVEPDVPASTPHSSFTNGPGEGPRDPLI